MKDVTEEKSNGHSSMLLSMVLCQLNPILIRPEMELVNIMLLKLSILLPITLIFLLETVMTLLLLSKLNLFLLLLMLVEFTSNFTLEESLTNVELLLIMLSSLLD
jgi:hypothetical protein